MKKFTDFLEKNCQWLALGAGALYLIYMVYAFVLTGDDFVVPVNGEQIAVRNVDTHVKEKYADPLEQAMSDTKPKKIDVPNFGDVVNLNPKATADYQLAWINSHTQEIRPPSAPGEPIVDPLKPGPRLAPRATQLVEALPSAPAPKELGVAQGRSNVIIPPPAAQLAGGVPDPNAAAAAAQPASGTDIDWVTVNFKISLTDLAAEFQAAKIPSQQQQQQFPTTFLQVELIRQELKGDGTFGPEEVCPKLTTSTLPPFPADNAPAGELQEYVNSAIQKTVEMLQPGFYTVMKGDQWTLSKDLVGDTVVGQGGALQKLGPNDVRQDFNPATYLEMDVKQMNEVKPPLTTKEKQLINQARYKKQQEEAAQRRNSRPTSPAGGRGGSRGRMGEGERAPEDARRPPGRGRFAEEDSALESGPAAVPGQPQPVPQAQPSNYSQMFPLPQGQFDPRVVVTPVAGATATMADIVGWAHDPKAEPGKSYRYKVRYKVKNPLWRTVGWTKDPKLAERFAIVSKESGWTDPVRITSVIEFFFASGGIGNQAVAAIDVYRFHEGQVRKETFSRVAPGDVIGAEKNGIDFKTGYTLVDIRPDPANPNRTIAWMIGPDATLVTRDVKADRDSPKKKEMDQQAATATAAAANGATTPAPGVVTR